MRSESAYLQDIQQAARKIIAFTDGMSQVEFLENEWRSRLSSASS